MRTSDFFSRLPLRQLPILLALLTTSLWAYPDNRRDLLFANGADRPVSTSGGVNYHWYNLDGLCNREPFGIVANYHLADSNGQVRTQVQQQLAVMRSRGMRRLSLGIFFTHGFSSGTLVDSSDPSQVSQALTNIGVLLADVKAAGYSEVLFRFFPTSTINPSQPNFVTGLVDEYWNLITQVRPVVAAAGIQYRLDLGVELAPRDSNSPFIFPVSDRYKYPENSAWSGAVRTLWQRYFAAYGRSDTVGFSFFTDNNPDNQRWRVRHMRYVYEGHYPYLYAADIYPTASINAADKFIQLHDAMVREDSDGSLGFRNRGWIISESNYEDPLVATDLSSAILATGRTVFYLTQWPLDRAGGVCPDPDINVPPPYEWTVYKAFGF
ncbi:MAG: hypothetical protein WBP11_09795 [Dokdonella sp.]